jgi:hypothetical protein
MKTLPWTKFWDMYSGGSQKEDWAICFIEAPIEEACVVFYNRFGHSPHRVSCTCCGDDYAVTQYETLEEAQESHKNEFGGVDNCCIIHDMDITPDERIGTLPRQGYVWHD